MLFCRAFKGVVTVSNSCDRSGHGSDRGERWEDSRVTHRSRPDALGIVPSRRDAELPASPVDAKLNARGHASDRARDVAGRCGERWCRCAPEGRRAKLPASTLSCLLWARAEASRSLLMPAFSCISSHLSAASPRLVPLCRRSCFYYCIIIFRIIGRAWQVLNTLFALEYSGWRPDAEPFPAM